jgi:hypothetical protein
MLERPESTPWTSSTSSVDLRRIRALSKEVDDLSIGDGIKGRERVDKEEVL